jgi:predicted HicB family RNase H-like nuclease
MSTTQQLSRPKHPGGRPSKGDRLALMVRVPPGLAQNFSDEAAATGASQSDHMAYILVDRYYWRHLDNEEQGQRPGKKKGDPRADLCVRVPRDLRRRFTAEAAAAGASQSELMTDILEERYSQQQILEGVVLEQRIA